MHSNKNHSIWKSSLQGLQQDWRQVFTVHLTYTVLGVILFTPLVAVIGRLLLGLSNQTALADQDIIWFLLSPTGMAAIIFLAGLLITILAVEQASLMTLAANSAQGLNISIMATLRYTAIRAAGVFTFALRLVLRILFIALPFLAASSGIAWFLLTDYDINYYISRQPTELVRQHRGRTATACNGGHAGEKTTCLVGCPANGIVC